MILASDILNGRARPAPTLRELLRDLRPNRETGHDSAFTPVEIAVDDRDGAARRTASD